MTTVDQAAVRLCVAVAKTQGLPSPTARIAAWLIGLASLRGGFPVEVSYRQIQLGLEFGQEKVIGTGCHNATIRESLSWLEKNGLITIDSGAYSGGGHHAIVVHAR